MKVWFYGDSLAVEFHWLCPEFLADHPRQIADGNWFTKQATLTKPFRIGVRLADGQEFLVTFLPGMPTNGMSVPDAVVPLIGGAYDRENLFPAVPHDGLYGAHFDELPKPICDAILYKLADLMGANWLKREAEFRAVDYCGDSSWHNLPGEQDWYRRYITLTPMASAEEIQVARDIADPDEAPIGDTR